MTRTLVSLLAHISFSISNRISVITVKAERYRLGVPGRSAAAHRLLFPPGSTGRARFSSLLVAVITMNALLAVIFVVEAGNGKDFTANTDMTSGTNYNPTGAPTNTDDVRITRTSTAALRITASTVTMESLSVTNGNTFTISNGTSGATNSALNLGNSAGFTNTFSAVANDLVYLTGNSTLTIQGPNGGGGAGTGVLNSVLQSSGNFNIGTGSTLTISSVISGSGKSISKTSGGTAILSGANTYSGDTTIDAGTLALTGSGSSANSPTITIAGGATFDVSGRTSTLTLQSSQTLNGTGTVFSGTINCSASGLTMGSASPLTLVYANGNPTLTVTSGALTLASGNPVTINVSGSALTAGDYTLISSGSGGSVAGAVPSTVTVLPGGLVSGMAASLQITGGQLILNVASPTATNGNVSGQIVDSGGNPVEGAAVRMTGTQNRLTVTDAAGNYHFDGVETNGFYTVVPSRANFSFSPSQRAFSQLGQHTDATFSATSTGGGLNPLNTTEYFVRQQYVDFLNREPDESGLNFWVNNIESCGTEVQCREVKRIDTSAAFFLSIEFQRTGYLVYRTYQAAYGDLPNAPVPIRLNEFAPDTQEIGNGVIVLQSGWEQQLASNQQAYMTEFVERARFVGAYPGSMTPAEFVDRLFTNAGVTPSGNDRLAAIDEFGSASTSAEVTARGRALRRVAENSVLAEQEFNQAFVLMQYFGYMRRDPNTGPDTDFTGYNFWLDKLNTFGGNFQNADMVKAFLVSGEYRGRFPR